jgi:signal transduction histidine kinase
VLLFSQEYTDASSPVALLLPIAFGGIPMAIAMAVLRHGLFDIDIIISRSLTFGVLAVFIGVVYVGIVVGVGELFGGGEGSGFGLSVVATAVVAMGFQPVRVRVERWANRLVYGKRATPYEVLASFSHRATDESDEDVLARIPRLIVDGTGAVGAVVWVRSGGGFRAASTWPEADSTRRLPGGDGGFMDSDADVSLPVFHDGELLGGISMVAARGGAITPPELELVENLADGLGLTLRNAQLTAALRRQVKDLQRSRDRIVSAADAARRSLEHDLDSGPQQQLVAVKVKLGPVRKLAEDAGATRTAGLLADIESQAGDAIQAVRDFAAGVYPPLLGAEGLAVALTHETRKAAVPVHLEAHDVGRYPRDIESAVYFSILEALQNTAKYAEASQATVRLTARNGDLRFEVSDDGRGFDPTTIRPGAGLSGIADRIDTIGGTTTITSTPGTGTTITGSIPVSDHVPV